MSSLSTYCAITTIKVGFNIYLEVTGLSAGAWEIRQADFGAGPNDGGVLTGGSGTAPPGTVLVTYTSAIATTDNWVVHQPTGASKANRSSSIFTIVWDTTTTVNYIPVAPVLLVAIPGDTKVVLEWQAALACDSRFVLTYSVVRGTSSPPTGLVVSGLPDTQLAYLDTGRTNGTKLFYRIRASVGSGTAAIGEQAQSNILSVTPRAIQTYLGSLASG